MKELIGLMFIIGFFSCQETEPFVESMETENLAEEQIDSILTAFKFEYESPIVLDSSSHILIPISTELLEKRSKLSKNGYYSDDYPRYWNILFYNQQTAEVRLLTENKTRISQIYASREKYAESDKIMTGKILYEISATDFNQDKKLNGLDPNYLYSSDLDGRNLKRVSPENEDLQYFEVLTESNHILLRTLRDENQDSFFNRDDESVWYKAQLINQNWKINEIIDSKVRGRIEKLYFEQWLKKK